MVEIFVYFVVEHHPTTLHNSFYRHYAELYEYLKYEIFKWVVHTKICNNEKYSLYILSRYTYYMEL